MKIALGIEYDGRPFKGWQRQLDTQNTIQERLEKAITQVADHDIRIFCAGRTDTGVHALGQVIHFETHATRVPVAWTMGVNGHLPPGIRVFWSKEVNEEFHARFSATARRYIFVIYNHRLRPSLYRHVMTPEFRPLDADLMHRAAQNLVGEHDFSSFRSSECQAHSPRRDVHWIHVTRKGDLVFVDLKANAFLHHMVRNIVGVLIQIGSGRQPLSWIKDVLAARDRKAAGMTVPPQGLHLVSVDYPACFELPQVERYPLGF